MNSQKGPNRFLAPDQRRWVEARARARSARALQALRNVLGAEDVAEKTDGGSLSAAQVITVFFGAAPRELDRPRAEPRPSPPAIAIGLSRIGLHVESPPPSAAETDAMVLEAAAAVLAPLQAPVPPRVSLVDEIARRLHQFVTSLANLPDNAVVATALLFGTHSEKSLRARLVTG